MLTLSYFHTTSDWRNGSLSITGECIGSIMHEAIVIIADAKVCWMVDLEIVFLLLRDVIKVDDYVFVSMGIAVHMHEGESME